MTTRHLKHSKLQKLYKLEYQKVGGKIANYADTIVHKFDVATQKYIKFETPKKSLPSYYWHIDNLYIYDNDEKDIIDIRYCNNAFHIENNQVFKYSQEHKANLYEGKTSDYTVAHRQLMRDLVLYNSEED